MGVVLHWFLPTNGDSRADPSLGNAVGVAGSRAAEGGAERAPDIGYMGQIARSAEQLGFTAALTPTSSWCEDAWVMTAGLTQVTERFKSALVGSYEEVADRIAEYYALGLDEYILSGYPHLEEAYQVGEGVMPVLRRRGLLAPAHPDPVEVSL
jgi:alkanesulfonate monooxygenase SsuD/methylene tetrahydromethanopterin reductase-like flavin-dependent oxidoreductase (luciferase family)